jgi:uncharacterized membrane protein (UPF0127 family)
MTAPGPDGRDPLLDPPDWAPSWLPTFDDVRGFRALRWIVGAVFVVGLAAWVTEGANSPADPVVGATGDATSTTAAPDGLAARFGTIGARLQSVTGELFELCLLLADTPEERSQGLMAVTDLEGHDGMLFSNDAPSEGPFYMYRTVLPLTIAWWDGEGGFVSATDMVPCESEDPEACERYPPAAPYRLGLEVVQGDPLAAHFQPGSTLTVTGGSCPAPA